MPKGRAISLCWLYCLGFLIRSYGLGINPLAVWHCPEKTCSTLNTTPEHNILLHRTTPLLLCVRRVLHEAGKTPNVNNIRDVNWACIFTGASNVPPNFTQEPCLLLVLHLCSISVSPHQFLRLNHGNVYSISHTTGRIAGISRGGKDLRPKSGRRRSPTRGEWSVRVSICHNTGGRIFSEGILRNFYKHAGRTRSQAVHECGDRARLVGR